MVPNPQPLESQAFSLMSCIGSPIKPWLWATGTPLVPQGQTQVQCWCFPLESYCFIFSLFLSWEFTLFLPSQTLTNKWFLYLIQNSQFCSFSGDILNTKFARLLETTAQPQITAVWLLTPKTGFLVCERHIDEIIKYDFCGWLLLFHNRFVTFIYAINCHSYMELYFLNILQFIIQSLVDWSMDCF